jgi:hypothetical protein
MANRCLTRTTLRVIASNNRGWDGVPHVTQLINGTMMEFLKITKDYAINPKGMAFALLGSSHHALLENGVWEHETPKMMLEMQGYVSELKLNNGWVQGTLDLLEQEDNQLTLTDHKTWGSNKLARNMPKGTVFNPAMMEDMTDVTLQMNMYRIMAEDEYGWHVDKMQVQCTVRDGGLAATTRRGILDSMYLIPVNILPDEAVLGYFQAKAVRLQNALLNGHTEPCTPAENWNGNRCRSYCDVAKYCPLGIQYVTGALR